MVVPEVLDAASMAALDRAAQDAASQGVVVLRAAPGDTFCRGLSPTVFTLPPAQQREGLTRFADLLMALATGPVPSVAVVEGLVLGGGVALAAACDVVIASPAARFGLPETASGLPPHLVLAVLSRRTTIASRQRLALDGRTIDALEAQRLGLVDLVVTPDAVPQTVAATVRQLRRVPLVAAAFVKGTPAHAAELRARLDEAVARTADRLQEPTVHQALSRHLEWA